MTFGKFTELCNHQHNVILERFQHLKKKHCTHVMHCVLLGKISNIHTEKSVNTPPSPVTTIINIRCIFFSILHGPQNESERSSLG